MTRPPSPSSSVKEKRKVRCRNTISIFCRLEVHVTAKRWYITAIHSTLVWKWPELKGPLIGVSCECSQRLKAPVFPRSLGNL